MLADALVSSHVDTRVSDNLEPLNESYGGCCKVKATLGKIHEYPGMTFELL
jgi:hypothetical protein